ncbi:MAG: PAS domain-containing protein [Bacteroidales bacterium]|jgi:DUF438 domain-containing protein|nr:PAS domain-containing protein [Bacteroidales bacterium]
MDLFNYQQVSITVCDCEAIVIYMNEKAKATFSDVVGKSLFECHPPRAAEIIRKMLQDGIPNSYTIAKNGVKKMIHQTPWLNEDGTIGGLIEYSFVIPEEMPHYVRG